MPPTLDVVVFGATGFTGRLVAEHLFRSYGQSNVRYVPRFDLDTPTTLPHVHAAFYLQVGDGRALHG